MFIHIYPRKLQLNKANFFGTEARSGDLCLYSTNDIVSNKINEKRDALNFKIVIFSCFGWIGDVPRSPSYVVCIYFTAYSLCKSMFNYL